jgi:two-component system NtrC family sensor kinase
MARLPSTRIIRQLLPISVLGFGTSIVLFLVVSHLESASREARFRQLADQRLVAVRANVDIALNAVDMVVGHYTATPPEATDAVGFRRMVETTLGRHGFIQALSWDPRVTPDTLGHYLDLARREGRKDFSIFERDKDGNAVPVGNRPEYIPVYYIEPHKTNEKAAGFDLASHPVRRVALDQARDSGAAVATGRITLVQETGRQFGILVLAPVFRNGRGADAESNRTALLGYVSGVFRLGDLLASSVAAEEAGRSSQLVDLHLFDLSAPVESRLLAPSSSSREPDELRAGIHVAESFDVAGRNWLLVATPGHAFAEESRPLASYGMLAVALLATVFYLFYLKAGIDRAEAALGFARDMEDARRRLADAQRIAQLSHLEYEASTGHLMLGEGAALMLGLPEDMAGGAIHQVFAKVDPDMRRTLAEAFGRLDREPLDIEFRVGEEGRAVHALGRLPATGSGILISLQDVTARRAAERERAAMIERMAEAGRMESLGTLAGGIAHEINTPTQYVGDNIAFMKGGIASLLDIADAALKAHRNGGGWEEVVARVRDCDLEFLQSELPAAADQARDGTERIAHIVQAIKEFSYPSSKTPKRFDLNHMIEVATTVTRNQWKYVAELGLDLDPALPQIEAIEGEINQVLVNLIVNAAHAVAPAGEFRGDERNGRITISTRTVPDGVEIKVADNGVGISEANLRHIFELFFTTKPPGQGTGQGLAITQAIIRRHGGTIAVDSEPGKGAVFRIVLPVTAMPVTAQAGRQGTDAASGG